MPVANLYFHSYFAARRERIVDQTDALGGQTARVKMLAWRDYDLARVGSNLAHIKPLAGRNAETSALADGEAMHPGMFCEALSRAVDNRTGADLLGRARALDEPHVIAVRNKAYLLAFGLVRVGEPQLARAGANFSLGDRAERKKGAREFSLSEGKEKIR